MIALLLTAIVSLTAEADAPRKIAEPAEQDERAALIAAARTVERFDPARLLHDRDHALPPETQALAAAASRATLEQLLAHEDGAIRLVAVVGLLDELGPHALPLLLPLVDDPRAAPPRPVPIALIEPGPFPTEPQTVGDVVSRVVDYHLELSGYRRPDFAAYWAEREDRAHCLSWWRIALGNACRSSSPTPPDRLDEIATLRAEIDRLPPIERAWVLLALCAPWEGGNTEFGARELASEADLVDAARVLAEHGLLLALLRGEDLGSDDPDVRLRAPTEFPYARVAPFVLWHARELLDPEARDELLLLERRHLAGEPVGDAPSCLSAGWAIAAADLDPAHAREILRLALERNADGTYHDAQDRRAFLAEALWRHAGSAEEPTLTDWFFREEPQRGAFGFGRHRFASWLGEPEQRALLRRIASDPRLDTLDWQTLRLLCTAANASTGSELVSPRELRDTSHPLGEGNYRWSSNEERAAYPERTAALEAALARWRAALADWAR